MLCYICGRHIRGSGPWKVEGFSLMSLFLTSLTPTPEAPDGYKHTDLHYFMYGLQCLDFFIWAFLESISKSGENLA